MSKLKYIVEYSYVVVEMKNSILHLPNFRLIPSYVLSFLITGEPLMRENVYISFLPVNINCEKLVAFYSVQYMVILDRGLIGG